MAGFVVVLLSMGVSFLGIPPLGIVPLVIGMVLVGFSWNAVVGITAAYTSDGFGTTNLGRIYGTMFAVMPIGSGIGSALSGYMFDLRGNYEIAIWTNIVLLVVSAVLVWSIGDNRPGARIAEPCRAARPGIVRVSGASRSTGSDNLPRPVLRR